MTVAELTAVDPFRRIRRFFRTPKGLLLALFAPLAALSVWGAGANDALPSLTAAILAAAITDLAVTRLGRGVWAFPTAAILSGMIVAFVLSPQEPLIVPIATAILAITSKQLFRTRLANVFNPAALALVVAAVFFHSGQSWWGALPDFGWPGVLLIVAAGWFIADRINKGPLVLAFLGAYFLLFTVASLVGDRAAVAEIYRRPDLHAVLFFALFMLDDPPTCPIRHRDQVIFGVVVAACAFLFFQQFGWLYYLLAALLVGNLLEAVRKWVRTSPRFAPTRVSPRPESGATTRA